MQADCESTQFSFRSFVYRYPLLFDSRSIAEVAIKKPKTRCAHPMVYQGNCVQCDGSMGSDYGIPVKYLQHELRISSVQAEWIRWTRTRNVMTMRKLHLVLDLDNTLLHTVKVTNLMVEQEYLKEITTSCEETSSEGDFFLGRKTITKLRPFVQEFLREANTMFEMTIYTMGKRRYAQRMARLIDPKGSYFGGRVISRQDCTKKGCKSLDVVLAAESNVIIIDDCRKVWPNHARNLVLIEPYNYFSSRSKKGREEDEQALSTILKRLRKIHKCYFQSHSRLRGTRDVRVLLQLIRS